LKKFCINLQSVGSPPALQVFYFDAGFRMVPGGRLRRTLQQLTMHRHINATFSKVHADYY
jgi:hypothetical protein